MIFPEGSHSRKRTIRNLSKGFTRIIFGAFEKYPDLKITIIPVGVTYQNASHFPTTISVNFGAPILSENFYNKEEINISIKKLKEEASNQLKNLSVHIPDDENYEAILSKLNNAQVDFTDVYKVNKMINSGIFPEKKNSRKDYLKPLYLVILLNSIFPYLIWKKASAKVDEIEFVDTFRFGLNLVSFPLF